MASPPSGSKSNVVHAPPIQPRFTALNVYPITFYPFQTQPLLNDSHTLRDPPEVKKHNMYYALLIPVSGIDNTGLDARFVYIIRPKWLLFPERAARAWKMTCEMQMAQRTSHRADPLQVFNILEDMRVLCITELFNYDSESTGPGRTFSQDIPGTELMPLTWGKSTSGSRVDEDKQKEVKELSETIEREVNLYNIASDEYRRPNAGGLQYNVEHAIRQRWFKCTLDVLKRRGYLTEAEMGVGGKYLPAETLGRPTWSDNLARIL